MTWYRASVGLFIAASATAIVGVLTFAWPKLPSGWLWLIGASLGLLGFVAGAAAAFLSGPEDPWWKALATGLVLLIASYAAAPIASAISSATYFWAHRTEAERVAEILLPTKRASGSASGERCDGLDETGCTELAGALIAFGSKHASGGTRDGETRVRLSMYGDYAAVFCPGPQQDGCSYSWSVPMGGDWHLTPR